MKRQTMLRVGVAAMIVLVGLGACANAAGIEGYPTSYSVYPGNTIDFHLSNDSGPGNFQVQVHRKGLAQTEMDILATGSGTVAAESVPPDAYSTGCNWPVRFSLAVPSTWRSGVYTAEFSSDDGSSTEVLFVVLANTPGSSSNILMSIVTATPQAYNPWGGKSLYDFNSTDGRASQVSFQRPLRDEGRSLFYYWEYAFIRWLEKIGIEVEFCTSLELHTNPALLGNYQLFLSVGHDEYWSKEMRDQVEAFIAGGGNAAFFGGNTCWWQVRFDSADPTKMICYKCIDPDETITLDPIEDPRLRTQHWFTDTGPNRPENLMTGLSTRKGSIRGDLGQTFGYEVRDASSWVFAGTGLVNGSGFGEADDLVGYETDAADFTPPEGPPEAVTGSDGTAHNFKLLCRQHANWTNGIPGWAFLGLFQNNGTVFNAGTINWSLSLIPFVDRDADPNEVCHITENVLRTLSSPKSAAQRATINIYQYYAVQTDGDGVRFWSNRSPYINDGWTYNSANFRAYLSQLPDTVPVYQHHAVQANGDGWRYLLSTNPSVDGWILDGVSFYAYTSPYNDPTNGPTIPIYGYHADQANGDGYRTLYSPDPNIGEGWIYDGVAFHAFNATDF